MEVLIGLIMKERATLMNKENRKELVMKAMQEKRTPGIFKIQCKNSEILYLGASLTLEKALNRHVGELKCNSHKNLNMQSDWNKFGEEAFSIETIAKVPEDRDPDFTFLMKLLTEQIQIYTDKGFKVEKLLM